MKFKIALLCAATMALSGCNKNDIDCGDTSVQNDLNNRLLAAIALESGIGESNAQLQKHLRISLKDYAQDDEKATKTAAQCTANLTMADVYVSGKAMTGPIHYELFKNADSKIQLDADSVRSGLDLSKLKVIKIDETDEQKQWRQTQEKEKAEQARQQEEKKAAEEAQKAELEKHVMAAKTAADSEFKPVTNDQLMLIFLANSGRNVTDDEKLGLLSDRWNAENDPFKRNDMKQEELAQANEKLSSFKDIKFIKVSKMLSRLNNRQEAVKKEIVTGAYLGIRKPEAYDFAKKNFPIDVTGCGDSLKYGPKEIYSTRQNVKVMLEKSAIQCNITPANEDEARSMSSILSNIPDNVFSAEGTAYLMINGYNPDEVTINTTLIREDVAIYRYQVDALNDKAPVLKATLK